MNIDWEDKDTNLSAVIISNQVEGYDKLKFFKENDLYWAPASTTSGLYTQLYENKYREMPRTQLRSVL